MGDLNIMRLGLLCRAAALAALTARAVDVPVVAWSPAHLPRPLATSEDGYYISPPLITFIVSFLVGGEPVLLHLGWLVLPGHVGAEVGDADEVAARRLGSVQL